MKNVKFVYRDQNEVDNENTQYDDVDGEGAINLENRRKCKLTVFNCT